VLGALAGGVGKWTRCHIQISPVTKPAGCYLMQLTMRKFDVKKNCFFRKDLMGTAGTKY
jgi:hypothetical protein